MSKYLVSFFTGRVIVSSFIIDFIFNVFRNTIAYVLMSNIVILYLWHQLWIVLTAVFAFISNSLWLPLTRIYRSSTYAAKSIILSSLSRRPSRSCRYVFHNMSPSMEHCEHRRFIFLLAIHFGVFIRISRNKTEASCRHEIWSIRRSLKREKSLSQDMRSKALEKSTNNPNT